MLPSPVFVCMHIVLYSVTSCTSVLYTSCTCVLCTSCTCVLYSSCTCVLHTSCTCVLHTSCTCVLHTSCTCVLHTSCTCVLHTSCTCVHMYMMCVAHVPDVQRHLYIQYMQYIQMPLIACTHCPLKCLYTHPTL